MATLAIGTPNNRVSQTYTRLNLHHISPLISGCHQGPNPRPTYASLCITQIYIFNKHHRKVWPHYWPKFLKSWYFWTIPWRYIYNSMCYFVQNAMKQSAVNWVFLNHPVIYHWVNFARHRVFNMFLRCVGTKILNPHQRSRVWQLISIN